MTRRDYCEDCSEMVGDEDVGCEECGISLCHDCATTYDELSRLAILQARFRVLSQPTITNRELNQLNKDLRSDAFAKWIEENDIDVDSMIRFSDKVEDNDELFDNEHYITEFMCNDLYERIPFICNM